MNGISAMWHAPKGRESSRVLGERRPNSYTWVVAEDGFDTLGLTEVHATVAASNDASLVLLDRIGFEHVRDIEEDDGHITRVLTRRATAIENAPLGQ